MAEVNDLSFRLLVRKNGVNICWTGMLNAHQWLQGPGYQNKVFETCEEDHPLIGQLAGRDYDQLIKASKDLSRFCDAIDINLGCTQSIASRGGYGYYMVNTEKGRNETLEFLKKLKREISVPICVKIRIFIDDDGKPNENITLDFAKKLEASGVSLIQFHGRYEHRDKASNIDIDMIRKLVSAVQIPVIANGGVKTKEDAYALLEQTSAAGVSVAQALLYNPSIFSTSLKSKKEISLEYLYIVKERAKDMYLPVIHVLKIYRDQLSKDPTIVTKIKEKKTVDELITFIQENL